MTIQINASSTNAEKIALFRSLFVGREDVFARRYENVKKGKVVVMLDPSSSLSSIEFYRSTRREDVLLQKNGYRVLRMLVEDVCTDLDAALDAIQG